jgi:hypothetical protein
MVLDGIEPLKTIRNSQFKIPIAVTFIIIGAIVLGFFGLSTLWKYDYAGSSAIPSEYYYSVPLIAMFEGDEIEIIYEVSEGLEVDLFIFDKSNFDSWVIGESYSPLFHEQSTGATVNYVVSDDFSCTNDWGCDIYIVFENGNSEPIVLDVTIEDKTATSYFAVFAIIGLLIIIIGILVLMNEPKEEDEEDSSFSSRE